MTTLQSEVLYACGFLRLVIHNICNRSSSLKTSQSEDTTDTLICFNTFLIFRPASSESLPTNHEVPGSIPGSTVEIFSEGEDSRGDHGLGRLVESRFKGPPGSTSFYITTHIIGTT